jgi:uncharacterized protein DUF6476
MTGSMRALKVMVVVMGVMLVGGTALLIAAIIARSSYRAAEAGANRFERAVIDLPEGARVLGAQAAGDRVVVRIALQAGGEQLLLIDARNGERLGTIELRTASGGVR